MKTENQKKILIIDDDLAIAESLKIALPFFGFQVKSVSENDLVFTFLLKFKPDLILLDYFLDGEDGLQLAERIRQTENDPKLKIVMFSAHPTAQKEHAGKYIDAFVAKPFDLNKLVTKIKSLID